MISIVDYGMGNLRSVQKAFERIRIPVIITSSPANIIKSSKLILPGVGHFAHAMDQIRKRDLMPALSEAVLVRGTPILGICLGMQLLTEFSEEGNVSGLAWIQAQTRKFSFERGEFRIPHMGWNRLVSHGESPLLAGVDADSYYYFVHSYYIRCDHHDTISAETNYGQTFVSSFQKDNIFGCQFHPEKSHDAGLKVLRNFANL